MLPSPVGIDPRMGCTFCTINPSPARKARVPRRFPGVRLLSRRKMGRIPAFDEPCRLSSLVVLHVRFSSLFCRAGVKGDMPVFTDKASQQSVILRRWRVTDGACQKGFAGKGRGEWLAPG